MMSLRIFAHPVLKGRGFSRCGLHSVQSDFFRSLFNRVPGPGRMRALPPQVRALTRSELESAARK